jgi:homoserine dehydrogenase
VAELRSAYYLTIDVEDRPGVLGLVSTVFGDHHVSIRSMEQIEQEGLLGGARLIFLTHAAREGDMNETIDALGALDAVKRVGSTIRVFGEDST